MRWSAVVAAATAVAMCTAEDVPSEESSCTNTDEMPNSEGQSCSYYMENSGVCGEHDTTGFEARVMCCACGGGLSMARQKTRDESDSAPALLILAVAGGVVIFVAVLMAVLITRRRRAQQQQQPEDFAHRMKGLTETLVSTQPPRRRSLDNLPILSAKDSQQDHRVVVPVLNLPREKGFIAFDASAGEAIGVSRQSSNITTNPIEPRGPRLPGSASATVMSSTSSQRTLPNSARSLTRVPSSSITPRKGIATAAIDIRRIPSVLKQQQQDPSSETTSAFPDSFTV